MRPGRRRVPVYVQNSRAECGAACLAMILGAYGYQTSVRETRDLSALGRDGASAAELARVARRMGMTATGHRIRPGLFEEITLPAIAHWEGDHFVVVERVGPRQVQIVDPRWGRRRLSPKEFEAGLGRAAIALSPGPEFRRRGNPEDAFWRTYLRSLSRLPGTRGLLTQVLVASAVIQLIGLTLPLVIKTAVDGLTDLHGTPLLGLLGAGIAVVVTAQLTVAYLRSVLMLRMQGRLDAQATLGLGGHLVRLPLRYFQQRSTGDIVTRIGSIITLREQITGQTLSSFIDAAMVLSYLFLLFLLDLGAGLLVFGVIVFQALLLIRAVGRVRELMAADVAAHADSQGYIVEAIQGIATLKSSGAEGRAVERWAGFFLTWMRANLRRTHAIGLLDATSSALRVLTPLSVLLIGTARVLDGGLSVGTMLAATWLSASVVSSLSVLVSNAQRLQLAGVQLQRLGDALEAEPEYPFAPPTGATPSAGAIEISELTFQYDPNARPALHNVSVRLEAGQRVAVVGPTGAGKSTLGLLLLGMYPPTAGEIRIDGTPIQDLDPRVLRAAFGVVLQEPFIFGGTIRDNIAFFDPDVSRAEVEEAARIAVLHEEIAELPNGYETKLGERGSGLSGGQRQRLAIARALVRRPAVLLLDEATSHLDAETEARLHANLGELRCTQIIIAHRLSTVRNADQILMLEHGWLRERGRHEELLAGGGGYARLVTAQLDGAERISPTTGRR